MPRLAFNEPSSGSMTTRTSAAAVVDDAALLADRREADAPGMQRVELCEDGILGLGVDDERQVTALARVAGLDDPLAARGMLGEHLAQPLDGPPAGREPVGTRGIGGR